MIGTVCTVQEREGASVSECKGLESVDVRYGVRSSYGVTTCTWPASRQKLRLGDFVAEISG